MCQFKSAVSLDASEQTYRFVRWRCTDDSTQQIMTDHDLWSVYNPPTAILRIFPASRVHHNVDNQVFCKWKYVHPDVT
jgi:hypothetical protein